MIQSLKDANLIVIKIGTSSLRRADGSLDAAVIGSLVDDVADLWRQGKNLVIITSGAVGLGSRGHLAGDVRTAAMRGQPRLMSAYLELFDRHGIDAGQLLLTNEQFGSKKHVEIFTNAINRAFSEKTVVIINENDPISTEETTLGDNDALAAKVACSLKADALIMLSVENGAVAGRGGGTAKSDAINKAEKEGILVLVLDGKEQHVVKSAFEGNNAGHINRERVKAIARGTGQAPRRVKT